MEVDESEDRTEVPMMAMHQLALRKPAAAVTCLKPPSANNMKITL